MSLAFFGLNTEKRQRINGHFFRRKRRKKACMILPKKATEMDTFQVAFLGSKRLRFEWFFKGAWGCEAFPQQGRLRHEVASKHRACQTP
jgi:hypothetical protein